MDLRQKPTDEDLAKPSGMLDLHEESGLAAIRECGLYNEFLQLTGDCAEAQIVADKDGYIILYADEGELSERPEISRHALTKLLSSQLPAEAIKWGHKLISARFTTPNSTKTELEFDGYGTQTFDLVIGADGAWSRIRTLLSDVKPHYAGMQNITVTIRHITAKYPDLAAFVGRGSFAALGLRHGVLSQRGPDDSVRVYIILFSADERFASAAGLAGKPAALAKQLMLDDNALLGSWGPVIKKLVATACDEESADNPAAVLDIKPLYMLPIGVSWQHKAGVTIIGDAAHLMCPWAGEGVNLAMWDALLLGRAIIKARTAGRDLESFLQALEPLLREFELDMVSRAGEKAEETYNTGRMMFGENGAEALAGFFRSAYASGLDEMQSHESAVLYSV
ncbi:FAD-dependent oxidoreductase [Aspergillus clavatus NRRL 1]|uniref:Salicylate hydroxylase n=1 Tax=Aspergillus clavatus (strain ATCC 1007 / CBS 513.65 / DSM 816 / NCTC 3887 / NRRL 1 / QM 1276 / 107) TaxID=344612 RepID=A1CCW0_ASPCL|nr:salicylate hydroxylase [Aspergillus clavatus NRRL 1]EAW12367.1 salicylate hydroxylase [Aspergillus clavatus NRRL 1]